MVRALADLCLFLAVALLAAYVGWASRDARAKVEVRLQSERADGLSLEAKAREIEMVGLREEAEKRRAEWEEWKARKAAPAMECLVPAPVWDPRWLARHPIKLEGQGGGR